MKRKQFQEDFSKIKESVSYLWTKEEVKGSGEEGHSCGTKPRGGEREDSEQGCRSEP